MVTKTQYDYVILTVSDREGIVTSYSATKAIKGTYTNTETFIEGFEGISISIYDDFEDFTYAIVSYKLMNCKYLKLLDQ